MTERKAFPEGYMRPAVWKEPEAMGGQFGAMNRPTAGARTDEPLPRGEHDIHLYSLATPNGIKCGIMLEELGIEYDAWIVNIMEHKQFTSGFTECNPNQKIPTMYDYSQKDPATGKPLRIFESGAMLLYLADKHQKFVPPVQEVFKRQECLNWLMWQVGTGPYMGGGFGHFFAYAPIEFEYCIDRFSMESKRELDVLNLHLAGDEYNGKKPREYICGEDYTIADIAIFPWVKQLRDGYPSPFEGGPKAGDFLQVNSYEHVKAWLERIEKRPAVKRGAKVTSKDMPERHKKEDFPAEMYAEEPAAPAAPAA